MYTQTTSLDICQIVRKLAVDVGLDTYSQEYVLRRFANEGLPFLTGTLPKLSKTVLWCIERGQFLNETERNMLSEFSWKGRFPRFMRGLLVNIFDTNGLPKTGISAGDALFRLRQFCDYFYKLATAFTEDSERRAEEKYVKTEIELDDKIEEDDQWFELLRKNFETFYPEVSRATVDNIFTRNRPRDTSGSFARLRSLQRQIGAVLPPGAMRKLCSSVIGTTIKSFRGLSGYFREYPSCPQPINLVDDELRTCEVLFVPKDSRGPRTIAREPMHMLRAQMAYFDFMVSTLQRTTAGRIQFTDQRISQTLARESSIDRQNCTLDLEEASDRVLYAVVKRIFRNSPGVLWFIRNTRSTHARLPSGRILKLKKLSSMGSGLTFPTMALLIHLSICTEVRNRTHIPWKTISQQVYVYGDDVVVPSAWYTFAVDALRRTRLRVNVRKSFFRGFFRESCGADYYAGHNVTPVRLKLTRADLSSPKSYTAIKCRDGWFAGMHLGSHGTLQLERHCRELFQKGFYSLQEYYYSKIEKGFGPLPYICGESPLLGRYTFPEYVDSFDVKAWTPSPVTVNGARFVSGFKFLGQKLEPRGSDGFLAPLFPDPYNPFGVIAEPWKVKLDRRLVSHVMRF